LGNAKPRLPMAPPVSQNFSVPELARDPALRSAPGDSFLVRVCEQFLKHVDPNAERSPSAHAMIRDRPEMPPLAWMKFSMSTWKIIPDRSFFVARKSSSPSSRAYILPIREPLS